MTESSRKSISPIDLGKSMTVDRLFHEDTFLTTQWRRHAGSYLATVVMELHAQIEKHLFSSEEALFHAFIEADQNLNLEW